MNKTISKDNNNVNETLESKIVSVTSILNDIRNEYENNISKMKNCDYTNLLERIVSAEKDLKAIQDKIKEFKDNLDLTADNLNKLNTSFQELSGSVNQLKLIVDEFKETHKEERANKLNFLFQIVIPIILAMVFFFSGLFFKSCSSIHQQNIQKTPSGNQNWEYRNFESSKNK